MLTWTSLAPHTSSNSISTNITQLESCETTLLLFLVLGLLEPSSAALASSACENQKRFGARM